MYWMQRGYKQEWQADIKDESHVAGLSTNGIIDWDCDAVGSADFGAEMTSLFLDVLRSVAYASWSSGEQSVRETILGAISV